MTNLYCRKCHQGQIHRAAGKSHFECDICQIKLTCFNCGEYDNLHVCDVGVRYVECKSCSKVRYWDESKKSPPLVRDYGCSYCGGSKTDCRYCETNTTAAKCHKCNSFSANQLRSDRYECSDCGFLFSPNDGTTTKASKIITSNSKIIKPLLRSFFQCCPSCQSDNISPGLDGVKCLDCYAIWEPGECVTKSPVVCPKCSVTGSILSYHKAGKECLKCGYSWNDETIKSEPKQPKKIIIPDSPVTKRRKKFAKDLEGLAICQVPPICPSCGDKGKVNLSKNCKYWDCISCETTLAQAYVKPQSKTSKPQSHSLCTKCKGGFISEDGHCKRCGKVTNLCKVCNLPYKDQTQTNGRCEACRIAAGTKIREILCPRCKTSEKIEHADLHCKCQGCEDVFAIGLVSEQIPPNMPIFGYSPEDLAEFERFREKRNLLEDYIDEAMQAFNSLQDAIYEGSNVEDAYTTLETSLQGQVELVEYIQNGDDNELADEIDEREQRNFQDLELWKDYDKDKEWIDKEREWINLGNKRNRRSNYAQVNISDFDFEGLLGGEKFTSYTLDQIEFCDSCRHPLNRDGICHICDCAAYS